MSDYGRDMSETIARLPGLESLPPEGVPELARIARLESLAEGAAFYREDEPGTDVYFILSGLAEARMRLPSGGEDDGFRTLKPGSYFGETAFLDGGRRDSTMVARERCLVLRLDGASLKAACDGNAAVGRAVYAALARAAAARLRDTELDLRNAAGSC